jgi:hypothetical protein
MFATTKFMNVARVSLPSSVLNGEAETVQREMRAAARRCLGEKAVGEDPDSKVQRAMLTTPVRLGGLGWTDVDLIAPGAFLAAALATLAFIKSHFDGMDHPVNRAALKLVAEVDAATGWPPVTNEEEEEELDQHVSKYAQEIAAAILQFKSLFEDDNNGKPPNVETDGFQATVTGLIPAASKFQQR